MEIIKMIYDDRIDVSEGIRTVNEKGVIFLTIGIF